MIENLKKQIFTRVLPVVEKPARYVGGEPNIIRKELNPENVRMALCFPDAYEVGMSNTGFQILYHIVNRHPDFAAERVFAPMEDMEEQLSQEGLPLYTLENFVPLHETDLIGFTLQYELCYTNILTILHLGKVPLFAAERSDTDPIVIAGGPCASNPEPLADYLDAVVLGDGEETLIDILSVLRDTKGRSRPERLRRLSAIEGVYVPSLYEPGHSAEGAFTGMKTKDLQVPKQIKIRKVRELSMAEFPENPILPLIEVTHDRLGVEIMRGCTRGCRFCSAGYFYRPVREKPAPDILRQIKKGLNATGWREVSLLSLSTTDHSGIRSVVSTASHSLAAKNINLSLPSLRADNISLDILENAGTVRKSVITIAPEAGSERMRNVINKNLTEPQILEAVKNAFEKGWKNVKLYFMIGLPTETEADIEAIIALVKNIHRTARTAIRNPNIRVSISPFSPKPHTPFQWAAFGGRETLLEKAKRIKAAIKLPGVDVSYAEISTTFIESVFSRGDRNLSTVIHEVWKRGARFDGWSEHFDFKRWIQAFEDTGIDPQRYLMEIPADRTLPWEHLVCIQRWFLEKEWEKACHEKPTPDCRGGKPELCCGVCSGEVLMLTDAPEAEKGESGSQNRSAQYGRKKKVSAVVSPLQMAGVLFRIQYTKRGDIRFLGHRDMMRIIERAVLRSGLPVAFSQGFNPHPRIAFSSPTAVGMESLAEYCDIKMEQPISGNVTERLNSALPAGIRAVQSCSLFSKVKALTEDICAADYEITVPELSPRELEENVQTFMEKEEIPVIRRTKSGEKTVNIRTHVRQMSAQKDKPQVKVQLSMGRLGHGRPQEVMRSILRGWPDSELLRLPVVRAAQWVERNGAFVSPIDAG